MVKINDVSALQVRKIAKSVFEISTVFDGYYKQKLYIGYNQKDAVKLFKQELTGTKPQKVEQAKPLITNAPEGKVKFVWRK